jgi:hypothetical protein
MNHRLRSHRTVCPFKIKLDLVNAQEYLLAAQKDHKKYPKHPEDLEIYLCSCCSYLHIGHRLGSKKEHGA